MFGWPVLATALAHGQVFSSDWRTPGDALLTLDTRTGFEWLDLTESQVSSFEGKFIDETMDAIVTETLPGGRFYGFEFATDPELSAFAQSAGIDLSSRSYDVNGAAAWRLIELLGNPQGGGSATGWLITSGRLPERLSVASFPPGRAGGSAGLLRTETLDYSTRNHGLWLRRSAIIPEQPTLGLALVGLLLSSAAKMRVAKTRLDT